MPPSPCTGHATARGWTSASSGHQRGHACGGDGDGGGVDGGGLDDGGGTAIISTLGSMLKLEGRLASVPAWLERAVLGRRHLTVEAVVLGSDLGSFALLTFSLRSHPGDWYPASCMHPGIAITIHDGHQAARQGACQNRGRRDWASLSLSLFLVASCAGHS